MHVHQFQVGKQRFRSRIWSRVQASSRVQSPSPMCLLSHLGCLLIGALNISFSLSPMQRQVTELLRNQLIEPSVSPYGAPLLFVLKKGGDLRMRMVIDYCTLNKLTVKIAVLKGYLVL